MLSKIKKYISERRERKFRIWCVKLAASLRPDEVGLQYAAEEIYRFVKKGPRESKTINQPQTDELKTRKNGVFIYTESKNLIPLSEWDIINGKATAVAIIDNGRRMLVALKDIGKAKILECGRGSDALKMCPTVSKARKDTNGRENTEALLKAGSNAAKLCKELGGKWYIPTLNDMEMMYSHQDELDEALEKAGGEILNGWYWTCNCNSDQYYFTFDWDNNNKEGVAKWYCNCVRPISDFEPFK